MSGFKGRWQQALQSITDLQQRNDSSSSNTSAAIGDIGERLFMDWLDHTDMPYLRMDQRREMHSRALRGDSCTRPDFLVVTPGGGMVWVDVKTRKNFFHERNQPPGFCIDSGSVRKLRRFQELCETKIRLCFWGYEFSTGKNEPPGQHWHFIKLDDLADCPKVTVPGSEERTKGEHEKILVDPWRPNVRRMDMLGDEWLLDLFRSAS